MWAVIEFWTVILFELGCTMMDALCNVEVEGFDVVVVADVIVVLKTEMSGVESSGNLYVSFHLIGAIYRADAVLAVFNHKHVILLK